MPSRSRSRVANCQPCSTHRTIRTWMIIPLTKGRRETYPCTHPVLLGREDGRAMTLGVGVLCDHGETIVIGSEQRASYRTTENIAIGPNDECGKQFYMKPHRVFVSVAGRMSTCHSVYSQFAHLVNHLKEPSNIPAERMMALIDEARFHTLKRLYDWELKKEMGVTLHQWASGRLPRGRKMDELVVKFGLKILEAMPFRCELIVGGFQDENAFFMRACQKGAIEEETSPGVYAIGIGQTSAMRHLNKRGQNVHMGLPRTLLHVY